MLVIPKLDILCRRPGGRRRDARRCVAGAVSNSVLMQAYALYDFICRRRGYRSSDA